MAFLVEAGEENPEWPNISLNDILNIVKYQQEEASKYRLVARSALFKLFIIFTVDERYDEFLHSLLGACFFEQL